MTCYDCVMSKHVTRNTQHVTRKVATMNELGTTEPPIRVQSPEGAYPIYVEAGALDRLGALCRAAGLGGSALVISDSTVGPLYGARAVAALAAAGYGAHLATMPAGEAQKTMTTVLDLI